MPICVRCRAPVADLLVLLPDGKRRVVAHCPRCGGLADEHLEHDAVHNVLGMILLRRTAWTHNAFNSSSGVKLLLCAMLAIAMEAYVTTILQSFSGTLPGAAGNATLAGPSFKFIDVLTDETVTAAALDPMPALRALGVVLAETLMTSVAMLWLCTSITDAANTRALGVVASLKMCAAATTNKLAYIVFLVWDVPLLLMPIIDASSLVFHGMAVATLTGAPWPRCAITVVFAHVMTRAVFRGAMGLSAAPAWAPLLV
jgi:hypothetical protein